MKRFFDALFWIGVISVLAATVSFTFDVGRTEGENRKDAEWRKLERCMCGDTQSCPFGPGVVGKQRCTSLFGGGTEWSRCEPDPTCCRLSSP